MANENMESETQLIIEKIQINKNEISLYIHQLRQKLCLIIPRVDKMMSSGKFHAHGQECK